MLIEGRTRMPPGSCFIASLGPGSGRASVGQMITADALVGMNAIFHVAQGDSRAISCMRDGVPGKMISRTRGALV